MALGVFAPGYYSATLVVNSSPVDLGLVSGVRRFRRKGYKQPMTADKFGDSQIDGVYRGGDCFLQMTFREWTDNVRKACWPFGADFGAMGSSGRLLTSFASQMVLTAEAGSPAAAASGGLATLTAALAVIDVEQDLELIMGNEDRNIPVMFQLFPYADNSSVMRWFSYT